MPHAQKSIIGAGRVDFYLFFMYSYIKLCMDRITEEG